MGAGNYLALKIRNEIVTPAPARMDLENMTLSERCQGQKDKYSMIPSYMVPRVVTF